MTTGQNILKRTLIVVVCLGSLTVSFLATRKPWVKPPVPGVQLSPTRPILRPEDVDPNGAFGKLQAAWDVLEAEALDDAINELLADEGYHPTNAAAVEVVKQSQSGLSMIREAVNTSYARRAPCVPVIGFDFQDLGKARRTFKLLNVSAHQRACGGDMEGAVQDLLDALQVGQIIGSGGTLIHSLVGISTANGCSEALMELAWIYELPFSQFQNAVNVLAETERQMMAFDEILRFESAMTSNGIDHILADPRSMIGTFGVTRSRFEDALVYLSLALSESSRIRTDINSVFSCAISSAGDGSIWRELETEHVVDYGGQVEWEVLKYRDPAGLLLAGTMIPSIEMSLKRFCGSRVSIRSAIVALALDQYEQANGVLPSNLDSLVPQYLDQIPEDPFHAGTPLLYKALPDRHWMIYSVGANGVDDGGEFDEGRVTGLDIGISTHHFVAATNGVGE